MSNSPIKPSRPMDLAPSRASARPPGRRAGSRLAPLAVIGIGASMILAATSASADQGPVGLGRADSFAILAGAGITNTGSTTVTGDIGTFPTPSQTGFGSISLNGENHADDAVTQGAKVDLVTAYDDAFGRSPAASVPVDLGGSTLLAGVYTSPSLGVTGTLTLDAQGSPEAVFVFQAGSTLITEVSSRVLLINGGNPCNVVWQVGSSATFKTGTAMVGDVLAQTSITAQRSATFRGRLLARNGAVTLDTNTITKGSCAPREVAGTTPTTSATANTGTTPTTSGSTPPTSQIALPSHAVTVLNPGPVPPRDITRAVVRPPVGPVRVPAKLTPGETATATPGFPLGSTPGTQKSSTPSTGTSLPATGVPAVQLLASGLVLLVSGAAATTAGRSMLRRPT